jgi:DNA repair exonuclease SbcCD ATPase subunit
MIERIWLRNFRRYVDEKIDLRQGINFIDGENNAGKSTVLYAIEYALFGRVGAIRQIHTLMHPGAKETGVELRFVGKDGKRYVLQRLHEKPPRSKTTVIGHFTLKVIDDDGERYVLSTDFQDKEEALALKLTEVLGLSRRLFDVAVHVKQGEIAAMLEGAPQLDTVLGVTASVLAADETRALALEAEKEASTLPVLEAALARLRDDVKAGDDRDNALRLTLAGIDAEEAAVLQTIERTSTALAALAASVEQVDALEAAADALAVVVAEVQRLQSVVVDDVEVLQTRQEQARASVAAGAATIAARHDERTTLLRTIGDLEGRIGRRAAHADPNSTTCETCGQAIDHDKAMAELAAWQTTLTTAQASLDDVMQVIAHETARVDDATAQLTRCDAALAAHKDHAAAVQAVAAPQQAWADAARAARTTWKVPDDVADSALVDHVVEALGDTRDGLRDERVRAQTVLSAIQGRRDEATSALQALKERRQEAARELASVEGTVERLREQSALAGRLRKLAAAFKELQVTLRDKAAAELATDVFALHRQLSAPDEEFKSLTIDPARYVINVTPHDIGVEVPAHLFQGGGHKVLLGLSFKLAVARRVGAVSFVLLDEPTYGLDEHRRTALLGRVAALDSSKQMVLITHHDVGDVAGHHIRIVKKGKSSMQEGPR